jgi:hypothetical protein
MPVQLVHLSVPEVWPVTRQHQLLQRHELCVAEVESS